MKNISQTITYTIFGGVAALLMFVAVTTQPRQAQAFGFGNLIDPLCLFACDEPEFPPVPGFSNSNSSKKAPKVTNNYTNSNNVNSNINSPGAVVNAVNSGNTGAGDTIAYGQTPVYDYGCNYDCNPPRHYDNIQVSCYPMPLTADVGDRVTWYASAYGGNGSYHYTWTGTNGLSGNGDSVDKRYNSPGYKNASVRVTSGTQTVSRNCDASAYIRDDGRDHDYDYDYDHDYDNDRDFSVSCSANTTRTAVGNTVRWTAYVSGGNGYNYTWDGTDNLHGSSQSIYVTYDRTGQKYASVKVRSNGRTITRSCSNSVIIDGSNYNYNNNYNSNTNGDLDVACYADPATARINQPVTWRAEVVGGSAPYTYSWTGSNELSGSESAIIKYYSTAGDKNAIVTIKSADGRSTTRACSNSLTIRSAATTNGSTVAPKPATDIKEQADSGLSAASLFSLKNVPWGWVAILIILVLFATVVYLIFNRQKI
jgi:hypothetical protein